jgi:mono/diheme cytochrome c family protein
VTADVVRRAHLLLVVATLTEVWGCGSSRAEPGEDGRAAFASACARCHGERGTGGVPAEDGGPAPRAFDDTSFQSARTDAQIRDVIVNGKGTGMPAFGATFDATQLASVVAVVRSFDPDRKKR